MHYQGSFQDIFFILAGLAWVAYSAYRSSNNKKKSSPVGSAKKTVKKSSLFEEMLAQYTQGADIQQQENLDQEKDFGFVTGLQQKKSSVDVVEPFGADDIYEEQESKKILDSESALSEVEIHVGTTEKAYNLKKQDNSKKFNLKKAFIYSEILNQKYIKFD